MKDIVSLLERNHAGGPDKEMAACSDIAPSWVQ